MADLSDVIEFDEENRTLVATNHFTNAMEEYGASMIVASQVTADFGRRVAAALKDDLYDRGIKAGGYAALAGFRRRVIREAGTDITIADFIRMIEQEMNRL